MFFSKFPLIQIRQNNKNIILTDIIRRVSVGTKYASFRSFLVPYLIKDGESPEQVSQLFFGSPYYHWVILLINEITHPPSEWPILSSEVSRLVYDKYDFSVIPPDGIDYTDYFSVDDQVTSSAGGEFVVSGIEEGVLLLRSQNGKTNLALDSILTNVQTEDTIGLSSVIDPEEAVHHYEDADGNWVDFDVDRAVSNIEYENDLNDEKRKIMVLSAEHLTTFVRDFVNTIQR